MGDLRDVASEQDARGITIQRVGVRDIHLPVRIRQRDGGHARVVGVFDTSVELAHYQRGTHMSRFVEILTQWSKHAVGAPEIEQILAQICERFRAREASLALSFKYFLTKLSPQTGIPCDLDYDCHFEGRTTESRYEFIVGAQVPITTLCPCSKEIAQFGAHSQRAELGVRVRQRAGDVLWLEELVPLLEAQGSAAVFPVLKRQDEAWVTEQAYQNPKFVEDVVRDTVLALRERPEAEWFSVECLSFESIHNHNAYAYAESDV